MSRAWVAAAVVVLLGLVPGRALAEDDGPASEEKARAMLEAAEESSDLKKTKAAAEAVRKEAREAIRLEIESGLDPAALQGASERLRAQVVLADQKVGQKAADAPEAIGEANAMARETFEAAQAAKQNAETAAELKNESLAAKNARLIRFGVTFGAAASVFLPVQYNSSSLGRLDTPVGGVTPFVAFLPGYWRGSRAKAAGCATAWSASEEDTLVVFEQKNKQAQRELTRKKDAEKDPEKKEALEEELADKKGEAFDTLNCWGYRFGVYVGYPAMVNATTTVPVRTAADTQKRDIDSVVSFGLAFTPNAFVSVLVGPAVGRVPRDDGTDATIWSMMLGLGGNADILGLVK